MNKKNNIIIILCFCLLSFYLYLYNPERKITLTLGIYSDSTWGVPNASTYNTIDGIIKKFEKKYPYVNVKYESGISKDDYSLWLSDKITKGNQPDLFVVLSEDFNLLSNTKALLNLDELMNKDNIHEDIFYPSPYATGLYQEHLYGLPIESNPLMMCVNTHLLEKEHITIPKNWTIKAFYNICKKVTKDNNNDGIIDQFGVCDYSWENVVEGYGIELFDETGSKVQINTTQTKEALLMYQKFYNLNKGYNVTSDDFDKGNVVFMPMTLAEYRTYKPYPYHVAKYSTFNWSTMTLPSSTDNSTFKMDTSLMAISSTTKHRNMSWEFLKMMSMDENVQQNFMTTMQGASPLDSVMNSKKTAALFKEDNFGENALNVKTIDNIMEQTTSYPKFKKYNTVRERTDYYIYQSIQKETIDSDLPYIEQKIKSEL